MAMGQPEGAGSGKRHAGSRRVVLARPSGRLYGTAMRVRGAKIPLFSYLLSPLRVPEGPQRFGMGPRNQHDGYRLMARRDGSRVRLFTRRGYDWSGKHSWIVAALRSPRVRSIIVDREAVWAGKDGNRISTSCIAVMSIGGGKALPSVKITWCSSSTCAKNLEAKGKECCSLK